MESMATVSLFSTAVRRLTLFAGLGLLMTGASAHAAGAGWDRRADLGSTQTQVLKDSVVDPAGDTAASGTYDILGLSAEVVNGDLQVVVAFANPVSLPDSGTEDALEGFIDIDVDQDGATGAPPFSDILGNTGMGNEFYVDLFSYSSVSGDADVIDEAINASIGKAVVNFNANVMTVNVPAAVLGGDVIVNVAALMGIFAAPTDVAPNNGSVASGVVTGPATTVRLRNRFDVSVEWSTNDFPTGPAFVSGLRTDDSGLFYFLDPNNLEFLVKVLDGCSFNNHFWVFFAATTDVAFTMTVTDTATQQTQQYTNPLGQPADAVTDTMAFATCP